jgi:hypothetical protein
MQKKEVEKAITQRNVLDLWASKYPEVTRWLTKLQRKKPAAHYFYRFCQWAHKTPSELLTLKEKDASISPPPNIVEKLLDDFCGTNLADFTNAEKFNTAVAVKSFFKWNYRDLAKASGVVSLDKVKPYNAVNKDILRRLWNYALNPRDRALIPFVTCTGIAKETLSNLTWERLEDSWETKELPLIDIPPELLKGHGKGKYKDVRQITFLTGEAKRELLVYKTWIEEKLGRKVTPKDNIWLETYRPFRPLSYQAFGNLINTLSKNAGVGFSWHDGRRFVNTALESISISQNWARKIRGRKVKGEEAPYSQPAINQLREKYREAVPLLEFIAERAAVPQEVQDRVKELEDETRKLRQQYRFRRKVTKPEEIEKCEDGKHCQQIVTEENLAGFLSQNWKVVATLPSGKIVIES